MTVQCIIFDLFGVVISFDDGLVNERIARHCPDPKAALAAMQGLVSSPALITGVQSLRELHGQLGRSHGLALDFAQFEALWREPYSRPMPGISSLLETLQTQYPLFLLSNVDPYYWLTIKEMHPELARFRRLLLSWELGIAKPDSRIFLHAAELAGVRPSACFFIDDKLENVEAAQELGFRAHHFRNVQGLRLALRQSRIAGI